ncbi:hypothetical protein CC78DRAFT_615498 [Lojkania enalia]|uniref:Uncharacterized protein n=1 Tax=Lojkania enalia TaxID=147567 RepID=A0A9P4KC31_9PLEO|nr:hypothetical protein CC78DRAFT_615498 [Didymosphaeria enalia]
MVCEKAVFAAFHAAELHASRRILVLQRGDRQRRDIILSIQDSHDAAFDGVEGGLRAVKSNTATCLSLTIRSSCEELILSGPLSVAIDSHRKQVHCEAHVKDENGDLEGGTQVAAEYQALTDGLGNRNEKRKRPEPPSSTQCYNCAICDHSDSMREAIPQREAGVPTYPYPFGPQLSSRLDPKRPTPPLETSPTDQAGSHLTNPCSCSLALHLRHIGVQH